MPKPFKGEIKLDVRDSTPTGTRSWPTRPPRAPNVLVVLYDDTGCAAWSPYGGRIGEGLCVGYDGGDAVSSEYTPKFEWSGGQMIKVVFDVADDAYLDVERHLAAAIARD